jgi:hypothetical protein
VCDSYKPDSYKPDGCKPDGYKSDSYRHKKHYKGDDDNKCAACHELHGYFRSMLGRSLKIYIRGVIERDRIN